MVLLQAEGVCKSFGHDRVLDNISLTLQDEHKMGVVGVNGSGKTTFLRIITGETELDGGTLRIKQDLVIGSHAQLDDLDPDKTLMGEMEAVFEPVFQMESRLRDMEQKMGEAAAGDTGAYEKLAGEYDRLTTAFEEAGGYGWRSAILGTLSGLGISRDMHDRRTGDLSGGEKTRVKLAKLLLQKPDLLLLDEPTNHLDLDAIAWLEGYLKQFKGALIVVSHDRYFLDAICNTIVEFSFGTCEQYPGNYTKYLQLRSESFERRMKLYTQQQKEIARQQEIIERYRRYNQEWSIRKAKTREHVLERMELVGKPQTERNVDFEFVARRRTGNDVLIAENLSKAYDGKTLFQGLDMHIRAGDRMALIGPNGVGKTTLLKILMGEESADTGRFYFGANVDISYYDQQQSSLTAHKTLMDEIWDEYPRMNHTQVRNALAAFLFTGDDVFKTVDSLSGGERGRVMFTKLMLKGSNVLLLDEPTNHLDMDSREVLEGALCGFEGTIVFVSHDRFFINRIANRIIEMRFDGVYAYTGNYDDFLEAKAKEGREPQGEPAVTRTAAAKEKRRERQAAEIQREKREAARLLERKILESEDKIGEIEVKMADPETYRDPDLAKRLALEYAALKDSVEILYARWEALQEG